MSLTELKIVTPPATELSLSEADGMMGQVTIEASQKVDVEYYAAMRLAYYKALVGKDSSQAKFLQGWTNRVNVKTYCIFAG